MNTNENGAVSSRRDYLAFGEESITADRDPNLGYTSSQDGVRKGYTGYEKDTEFGLDFGCSKCPTWTETQELNIFYSKENAGGYILVELSREKVQ